MRQTLWTGLMDQRVKSEGFKRFAVGDLLKRDKLNLDILSLTDDSLDDVDSLPPPDMIAAQIVDNLQAALEAFQRVAEELAIPISAAVSDSIKKEEKAA